MLKYIQKLVWGAEEEISTLDSAYDLLNNAQIEEEPEKSESEDDELQEKYTSQHRIGFITNIENCIYEIDNKYKFTSEQFYSIGMKIAFTIFKDGMSLKVTNVKEIVDEWSNVDESTTVQTWCERSTIVEVTKRQGRIIFVQPGDIQVDLNQTASEFIPIVGDFIELQTKSEVDEKVVNLNGKILEIIKVRPVRAKIVEGTIRTFNEKSFNGIINKDVFFNKEALLCGYIPKYGDRIVAEIIESNQGTCFWRALKIILQSATDRGATANAFGNLPKLSNYEHSADGIKISDNVTITAAKFSESQTFHFNVTNERLDDVVLNQITIEGQLGQVRLTAPKYINKLTIAKNSCAQFAFEGVAKSRGTSRETILFHFTDVVVGRMVYLKLESKNVPQNYDNDSFKVNTYDQFEQMRKYQRNTLKNPIRGEPVKSAPRFMGKKLNDWKVPDNLFNLYMKYQNTFEYRANIQEDLEKAKPCLSDGLTIQNYEERFHTLIFVEEIYNTMAMRKYDKERGCFITDPEYLILEVENLAESRPSIIIGDKIIATCLETQAAYEGFVHKISGSHIFLKFTSIFRQQYKGEDYGIHVVPSRSSFRRLHQAIFMAKMSIPEVLFPNHVYKKKIQVKFTYEPYDDIIHTTDKKMKNRVEEARAMQEQTTKPTETTPPTSKKPGRRSTQDLLQLIKSISTDNKETAVNDKARNKVFSPSSNRLANRMNAEWKLEWFDKSLNYYQKEAVRNILVGESRPLPYIIFGPPGTGKTVTVIECILQILRMIPHSRLLVGTPSNSAANLLTSRLIESGSLRPGDLVRLVSYKSICDNTVPPKIIPYCALASVAKEGTTANENVLTEKGYVSDMTMTNIGRHRITIGTCSSLGALQYMHFRKGHFTHVIIDEAGQCTEPDIMIPLSHVDISDGQIIIAGDPMQLGPVVLADEARKFGYEETYLDRLINRFPYIRDVGGFANSGGFDPRLVTKLLYNYRSLPELLLIPNSCFYHNELRPTISTTESEEIDFLKSLSSILPTTKDGNIASLVFHGISGINEKGDDCPSWFNPDEAAQVFYYINQLFRVGVKKEDIGVISPYIKQVRLIREILKSADFDAPKIGTVEEFQGLEFKVIVLSTVRSNAGLVNDDKMHGIGFISNPRRFNVSLTRSKCLTVVIGNPRLLATDSKWSLVLSYCLKNKSYVGCEY